MSTSPALTSLNPSVDSLEQALEAQDLARRAKNEVFNRSVGQASCAISHNTDGPVTDFVMISRAVELAAKGVFQPDVLAEALHNELTERGFLREGYVERSAEERMYDDGPSYGEFDY